jgi:hypothetical protein
MFNLLLINKFINAILVLFFETDILNFIFYKKIIESLPDQLNNQTL